MRDLQCSMGYVGETAWHAKLVRLKGQKTLLNAFVLPIANTLVEKQRAQLVEMHKDGCP